MKQYYRLSKSLKFNQLIPTTDNVYDYIDDLNKDWYLSVFKYNQEHYDNYQKTKSLSGSDGVIGNMLYWDFDSPDLEESHKDAKTLCCRLLEKGIIEDDLQIAFSGNKGFAITVDIDQDFTPKEVKRICANVAKDLSTFDAKIYDNQRILRVPLTKHQVSGFYKTPLTFSDLEELTVGEIVAYAHDCSIKPEQLSYDVVTLESDFLTEFNKVDEVKVEKKLNLDLETTTDNPFPTIDWNNRIKFLTPEKFVLHCGYIEPGKRHEGLMILASTHKFLGYSKADSYRLLKSTIERQAEIYDQEAFSHDEVWTNILKCVYADKWNGGLYGSDHPILMDIHEKLPKYMRVQEKAKSIISNSDIFDKLDNFIDDIEHSQIKTGIKTLDDDLLLLRGASVGIVGIPGCHAKGTEVVMFDGSLKKVEDVVVGDQLMGPDSEARDVLQLCRGREEMVRITPNSLKPYIVNKNHIMSLSPSKEKQKGRIPGMLNITVDNYIKGIENKSATLSGYKLYRKGCELPEKDLLIEPYYLGMWLADGTSENTNITTMEPEVFEYLEEYADHLNLKFKKAYQTGKAYTCTLTNGIGQKNPLLNLLRGYDVSNNKHIPEAYLTASRKQRLELLAGLIDGDGCLEQNKKGWSISLTNVELAKGLERLALSLGFHVSRNTVDTQWTYQGIKKTGVCELLYISGLEVTYDVPIKVERKKIKQIMTSKIPTHYGFTYEVLPEDDYYGFTLNNDHLYLTSDYIVQHNSGKTTFLLNILRNNSMLFEGDDKACLMYSLDMSAPLIGIKQMQFVGGKSIKEVLKLKKENIERYEQIKNQAIEEFKNVDFSFKYGLTPADIREDIIDYEERTGKKVSMIVVDYLESVQSEHADPIMGAGIVAQQITNIGADLDLTPFILLQTQKSALPGEPIKSMRNVKGSSVIEQSMSVIAGIHREGQPSKYQEYDTSMGVTILKNRFGQCRSYDLGWDGKYGIVSDLTKDQKLVLDELREIKTQEEEEKKAKSFW